MSISVYYTARRSEPLSATERGEIRSLVNQYAVESEIERYHSNGEGPNWQSFCVYDVNSPSEPGIVFEGATGLPDNSADAVWIGLQHWCRLLSELRRVLKDSDWHVHVDDHDIEWDSDRLEFDPSV